jgi:S-adenosylmethionine:tRNA ribosyltransferase-isomerase
VPTDLSDFDFELPAELIAQEPSPVRGDSRLLVLDRRRAGIAHAAFAHLPELLQPGDLIVMNDTRVFPARLLGRREPGGGAVECLLVRPLAEDVWEALMHPGQRLRPGTRVVFGDGATRLAGEVLAEHFHGRRTIRLTPEGDATVEALVDRLGHVPLPPYIKRNDRPSDRERYQTVYARERGSIAAPTAGLHFTDTILASLAARGIERLALTLHVGYGTFRPIRASDVDAHVVDPEPVVVSDTAAETLTRALQAGRRIVAVGTTTVRALESLRITDEGRVESLTGETDVFIRPGHRFRLVGAMITNFHLPRSSLLVLVSAFAGRETVLAAYREAVMRGYRFYSYGDAMLIV